MSRNLNSLPIPPQVRLKLHSHGFTTADDLKNITPVELAEETELTPEEALEVLELISPESGEQSANHERTSCVVSALDILLEEKSKPSVVTFCQKLDYILGGGVPLKKLTEVCGCPGTGKTQLCFQLSVNVQVPISCGGLDGEAIFIDTEGSFFVERLKTIADATVHHCTKLFNRLSKDGTVPTDECEFTLKKALEGVHCYRCKNYVEVIALVNILPEFLKKHPKVRIILVDSISFHFRHGFEKSYDRRARLLNGLTQSLVKIAQEFNVAVVLTNQMTTKANKEKGLTLVPALGESWGHSCTIRLILSFDENKRQALLFKSPWKKEDTALFQITASGIRDLKLNKTEDQRKSLSTPNLHEESYRLQSTANLEAQACGTRVKPDHSKPSPPLVQASSANPFPQKRPRRVE